MQLPGQLLSQDQLDGVDTVFHLAGVAHQQASEALHHEVNFQGTLSVARQAAQAGVARFVFVSSVKAMGQAVDESVRAEHDCSDILTAYGRSKLEAERALREEFAQSPMTVAIIRPALVYDEAPKGNLALLAAGVRRGMPGPPALGKRSMIARDDLVEILCRLGLSTDPIAGTWIACDGQGYSTRDIYDGMRSALGRGRAGDYLPLWLWKAACAALDLTRSGDDVAVFEKLFGTELYSSEALVRELGWQPVRRLQQYLPSIVAGTAE
jgi:UDP-N-acetyl-alpha-D-quinovosamine dehydrogenase